MQGAAPLDVPGADVVDNPDWAEGMGSSLRAGLAALPPDVKAAVVLLVDQPALTPAAVRRVVDAAGGRSTLRSPSRRTTASAATRCCWGGCTGRRWRSSPWGTAARVPSCAARRGVVEVPCGDVADPGDVDTPADLERLRG